MAEIDSSLSQQATIDLINSYIAKDIAYGSIGLQLEADREMASLFNNLLTKHRQRSREASND